MARRQHVAGKVKYSPNENTKELAKRQALWAHEEFKKGVFLRLYPGLCDIIPNAGWTRTLIYINVWRQLKSEFAVYPPSRTHVASVLHKEHRRLGVSEFPTRFLDASK